MMRLNGFRESVISLFRWWFTPISTDRDKAFRERVIRNSVVILFLLTTMSFTLSAFILNEKWGLISVPTLHIVSLLILLICIVAIVREQITLAAWLLVLLVLLGVTGLIILARIEGTATRVFSGVGIFMFPTLVTCLILPRSFIFPMSFVSLICFGFSLFAVPVNNEIIALRPLEFISNVLPLLAIEALILWRLRVEFDARFEDLTQSLQYADSARKRAEEADRTKSQFLANMSHELRTPLNAIIGYDEAMLAGMAGEFTPQQRQLLGHIQHNSRRLLNLINDILDLSKIEAGSMEVYVSPMSPKTIIGNTVDSLRSLATEKNISLDVTFSEDFPEVIMGDTRKIEQVLVNLLSNAIKFTEDGGINVQGKSIDDSHWQFCVIDTGIGMSEEAIQGIFDPFTQVDGSTTRKYKGTGLGLSITKQLVEMMDGKVEVESTPNVGTTFTVLMPKVKLPQTGKLNEISSTV